MKVTKLAAIDIGSNAVRLLIMNVIEEDEEHIFKKSALVRVPIRLGADAFSTGVISEKNMQRMQDAMIAFQHLMKVHDVQDYRACATSAMRTSKNGLELIEKVKEVSGIAIEIIDGEKEATIISSTELEKLMERDRTYLFVDVGGGSTEFSVFKDQRRVASASFKIGTVRLINDSVNQALWDSAKDWVKSNTRDMGTVEVIGSGGNINKIFKMSGRSPEKPLSYTYLSAQRKYLASFTFDERVKELGLNPDRADVILPAMKIYLSAMKWAKAKNIYAPKFGLADGIIKSMYFGKI